MRAATYLTRIEREETWGIDKKGQEVYIHLQRQRDNHRPLNFGSFSRLISESTRQVSCQFQFQTSRIQVLLVWSGLLEFTGYTTVVPFTRACRRLV